MARKPWAILLLLALVGWWVMSRPRSDPAERLVDWSGEPVQTATDRRPFEIHTRKGRVRLAPRAEFEVSAVVASAERYRFDDGAFLSPVDFALLWGELPEEPYRSRVSYSQMTRFFYWRTDSSELDLSYIAGHAANMHLIPGGGPNLEKALFSVGRGDRVRLRGLLVDAEPERGGLWKTSTTRVDTGPGACELVWVEELQVGDRLYR